MQRISVVLLLALAALAAETDRFRLSMQNIQATLASMKGLTELLASDPALLARFKTEKKKLEDTNGRDALSLTAARLQATEPRIGAVYRKAGITPKEAGMTLETLLGVMMGDAMLGATKTKADLPEGFVAENVEFYRQNKPAIMQALEQLKQMATALKDDQEDGQDPDEEQEEDR